MRSGCRALELREWAQADLTEKLRKWLIVSILMSSSRDTAKLIESDSKRSPWEEKLKDYLDGYFMSFDYYPICERHIFARNDAYALLTDFSRVAMDISNSTSKLVSSPESILGAEALESRDGKEIGREAARKALGEFLRSAFAGGRAIAKAE
jgi:hypothetical protein